MNMKTQQWQEKTSPARLERRFEFDDYDETREFLDKAAALSEQTRIYPDVSFGRTYVNMTIHVDGETSGDAPRAFARMLDDVMAAHA